MLIRLNSVSLEYPIHHFSSSSIKNSILTIATGGVIKNRNKNACVKSLSNISFDLERGDKLGLIGHNGAGKTSLLRVLAGIYRPTEGMLDIKGKVIPLINKTIGKDEEATGIENIFLRGLYLGFSKKEIKEYVQDIVEFADIGDFVNLPVYTYSEGMKLRLDFAISTMISPEILLIDEWLGVADASFQAKAKNRLDSFVKRDMILVIATHSLDLVNRMCNKVLWLEHGKVKRFGDKNTILSEYMQLSR